MTQEPTPTEPQTPQPAGGDSPPPGAIERLKRERDESKATAEAAAQRVLRSETVDALYGVLSSREGNPPGYDAYAAAKQLVDVGVIQPGVEVTAESVTALLDGLASVLPGNATPSPTPQQTPPPMAGVPAAAEGIPATETSHAVTSPEAVAFIEQHGMPAFYRAVANGQFTVSDETVSATATAQMDPLLQP